MIVPAAPALLAAAVLLVGCAGTTPGADSALERGAPVDLDLADITGHAFALSELRGHPVLLVAFATYDEASLLALTTLQAWSSNERRIQILAVAAQPQAKTLLPLHREALGLTIPLAYDPKDAWQNGESDLERVSVIPTYVLLDAQGRVLDRHEGPLEQKPLEEFVASARE